MALLQFKDLLEARAHFGHKKRNWNPKMKPYIYTQKDGLHIIDLRKSVQLLREAYNMLSKVAAQGAEFLFVGTKKQAAYIIEEAALRVGVSYVNERWLGGTLTNFNVIRRSIDKYNELCERIEEEGYQELPKKVQTRLKRRQEKMERHFKGIQNMERVPDILYVVDVINEKIAIKEAHLIEIPVVAIIDTNSDPDLVNYPIPANDDAIESIRLITSVIEMAIVEGRSKLEERSEESES
ncbi:MAG: 30S ribosomal protein S2 [Candidatus Stahlbacteria bacterium]|nr:30S ribosomal protein S2 [candidate division WOR-3 bacterium]TEU00494.1 MAG: 30S ribosomal protein S2 [Candidatus Stahlbacteria bacterium]